MIYLVASFFQGRLCISVVGIYNSQRAYWDLVYMGKPVPKDVNISMLG